MKTLRLTLLAALSALVLSACGANPTGPEADNINGLGTPMTAQEKPSANINGLGTP